MNKKTKDVLTFVPFGVFLGGAIGYIGSCGYIAFKIGRPLSQVQLTEVLSIAPWSKYNAVLWQHSLYVIAAFALVGSILMLIAALQTKNESHGSARWATVPELQKNKLLFDLSKVPGPIYAKVTGPKRQGKFISSKEIPHSLIAAPTGSGKGVGVVIPTLLTYPGSVICLDVKGENFEKSARRRAEMGDLVCKFSPFDPDQNSHCFNPLDYLKDLSVDFRFTEATRISHSLLVPPGRGAESFIASARDIFAATIILAIENGLPTIGHVYDILANGTPNGHPSDDAKGGYNKMFERLTEATKYPAARKVFASLSKIEAKTLSAYMSVLMDSGLGQWKDPFVRRATQRSDFTINDLRKNPASIYIVINPNDMAVLAPLTRLMFQQVVALLQRAEPDPTTEPYPVLLLMDEFASLGKMDAITGGITTIRSYGGRMMIIVQSIANLKDTYGHDAAQTFLANCRLQLFMAPADAETPEYVSKAIGDFTRKSRSKSWQSNQPIGSNIQERHEGARLLRPEDFRRLPDDEVVILIQGEYPVHAKKVYYYQDKSLKPIYEKQSCEFSVPTMPEEIAPATAKPNLKNLLVPVKAPEATKAASSTLKLAPAATQKDQANQVIKAQSNLLSKVASMESRIKKAEEAEAKKLLGKNDKENGQGEAA